MQGASSLIRKITAWFLCWGYSLTGGWFQSKGLAVLDWQGFKTLWYKIQSWTVRFSIHGVFKLFYCLLFDILRINGLCNSNNPYKALHTFVIITCAHLLWYTMLTTFIQDIFLRHDKNGSKKLEYVEVSLALKSAGKFIFIIPGCHVLK